MSSFKTFASAEFVESCGCILFSQNPKPQICILRDTHTTSITYVLPKGRRNINESRSACALRETREETSYTCRLIPITLHTRQPDAEDGPDIVRVLQNVEAEPFAVVPWEQASGNLRLIWWFVAVVEERSEASRGAGEEKYVPEWVDLDVAADKLTFNTDAKIVRKAVEIWRLTDSSTS